MDQEEKKKYDTGIAYKNRKWRPNIFIDADKREVIEKHYKSNGYKSMNEYLLALIEKDINE